MAFSRFTPADDERLRREAMAWLALRTNDGRDPVSSRELGDFTFDGEAFRLKDVQRGIWKPRQLSAALSIQTVYRAEGQARPYEDAPGLDGWLRYKWQGQDPNHSDNRSLREAWKRELPLIWYFGVGPALWLPVFPIYVLDEEPDEQQFVVDPDVGHGLVAAGGVVEETMRRYIVAQTKRRLHQPVFRASVMRAYETRCAVCALRHGELLDAAHIMPDSHEMGIAAVRNGLSLCKIHHAAFDANILGIRPDLVVQIRADLLEEIDGPMLRHGLQDRHGERLRVIPTSRREQPATTSLEERFSAFLSAG